MVGTSMKEPSCANSWCGTERSVKWSGPGEHGYWIAPTGEKFPFNPSDKPRCVDNDPRCVEWASWDSNECERNAGYMLVNCKRSCKACTIDPMEEL